MQQVFSYTVWFYGVEARSIPEIGQSFTFHGFRFRVLRKARNRITALRIQPLPKPAE